MILGLFILFVLPILIFAIVISLYDFYYKINKFKKNQKR